MNTSLQFNISRLHFDCSKSRIDVFSYNSGRLLMYTFFDITITYLYTKFFKVQVNHSAANYFPSSCAE